jgi:hypothetical protein
VLQLRLKLYVSSSGIEALSKLHHLQQFIFGEGMDGFDWRYELNFLLLCANFLPRLRVVGRHYDLLNVVELDECERFTPFDLTRGYHQHLLLQLQPPAKLSLQHLNLAADLAFSERFKFPCLESLMLWNTSNHRLCDRFASLTALGFYECNFEVLPVLSRVGQRLNSLVVHRAGSEVFSVAKVLQLCPHLSRFRLSSSKINSTPEQWPVMAFSNLQELQLRDVEKPFPPRLLKQVHFLSNKLYAEI